jgi:ArsR family transcriptional regulator
MPKTQRPDLSQALVRYRALSDETRMQIMHMLVGKERCVCELADALSVSQPLLSHHLKTLRESGLVQVRRSGRWMHYSLDADALDEAAGALAEVAASHRKTAQIKRMCC